MRAVVAATVTLLLIGGGLLIALRLLEDHVLFHPSPVIMATPAALGLPFENVRFRSEGEMLTGWFIPSPSPVATVLHIHGNAGNISHRLTNIQELNATGFSILVFDYRGYGESTGSPTEAGIYLDAAAAWEYLTGSGSPSGVPAGDGPRAPAIGRGISPRRIVVYGESIGSAPALNLVSAIERSHREAPAAVIVEGALSSARDMGRRIFPLLPVHWVSRARLDNLEAVKVIGVPSLFIHASEDEIVPISMGRRLHEASVARLKEFYEVAGARHNTVWTVRGAEVATEVRSFVERAGAAAAPALAARETNVAPSR